MRIIMTPKVAKQEHINRCYLADLALDNPVTNGHTTSCDLLWSGLPMITFAATEAMPSRVATSICHALGCGDDMVSKSYTDYAARAKSLALGTLEDLSWHERSLFNSLPDRIKDLHGSPKLKLLRHKIEQNRETKPLFQTEQWVRDLEVGLLAAHRQHATAQNHSKIENINIKSLQQNNLFTVDVCSMLNSVFE